MKVANLLFILIIFSFASIVYANGNIKTSYFDTASNSVGEILGNVVNDVVLNIHAQDPNSLLSQAHVMAIMCQELPSLDAYQFNSEGRLEGYTQVIDSTYQGLIDGTIANGACSYIANIENGACRDPQSRIDNARCSIELGACLYNSLLTKCNGDIACAYNAYNTGSIYKQANGLYDFTQGYNNLIRGRICAKAEYNKPVWESLYATVYRLTDGKLNTGLAEYIQKSPINLVRGSGELTDNNKSWIDRFKDMFLPSSNSVNVNNNDSNIINGNSLLETKQNNKNGLNHTSTGKSISLDPEKGAMYCVPSEVSPNEEFLLTYLCPSGSVFKQSENFNAKEPYGILKMRAYRTTNYSITCKKDSGEEITASCLVKVR